MYNNGLYFHLASVVSLLFFKLTVLFVGYKISKLGYDLLIKGITGEFKFKANIHGSKADLLGASPGLFFVLLGTSLIFIAVLKDKPYETIVKEVTPSIQEALKLNDKVAYDLDKNIKPKIPNKVPQEVD